ncbi:hypothetical protein DJ71_04865 [Halorubrum sp. E3]|nr:hypothetical protein DJ71_04865 [Halorubrum sp. E3]
MSTWSAIERWRARRAVLPVLDRLADGGYDDIVDGMDDRVGVDLEAAADQLLERTAAQSEQPWLPVDSGQTEIRKTGRVRQRSPAPVVCE